MNQLALLCFDQHWAIGLITMDLADYNDRKLLISHGRTALRRRYSSDKLNLLKGDVIMNTLKMPGFSAEAGCYVVRNRYVIAQSGVAASSGGEIVPQLWREVSYWTRGGWVTGRYWVDDPGGWGVAFGAPRAGDAVDQQCFARCRKIVDPQRRQNCLDNC